MVTRARLSGIAVRHIWKVPNLHATASLGIKFWTPIDTLAPLGIDFRGEAFVLEKERMAYDVDTGAVFKHPVDCFGCGQTLRRPFRAQARVRNGHYVPKSIRPNKRKNCNS